MHKVTQPNVAGRPESGLLTHYITPPAFPGWTTAAGSVWPPVWPLLGTRGRRRGSGRPCCNGSGLPGTSLLAMALGTPLQARLLVPARSRTSSPIWGATPPLFGSRWQTVPTPFSMTAARPLRPITSIHLALSQCPLRDWGEGGLSPGPGPLPSPPPRSSASQTEECMSWRGRRGAWRRLDACSPRALCVSGPASCPLWACVLSELGRGPGGGALAAGAEVLGRARALGLRLRLLVFIWGNLGVRGENAGDHSARCSAPGCCVPRNPGPSAAAAPRTGAPSTRPGSGDVGGWGGTRPPRPPAHTLARTHTFRRGKLRPGAERPPAKVTARWWRSGWSAGARGGRGAGAPGRTPAPERPRAPRPAGPSRWGRARRGDGAHSAAAGTREVGGAGGGRGGRCGAARCGAVRAGGAGLRRERLPEARGGVWAAAAPRSRARELRGRSGSYRAGCGFGGGRVAGAGAVLLAGALRCGWLSGTRAGRTREKQPPRLCGRLIRNLAHAPGAGWGWGQGAPSPRQCGGASRRPGERIQAPGPSRAPPYSLPRPSPPPTPALAAGRNPARVAACGRALETSQEFAASLLDAPREG